MQMATVARRTIQEKHTYQGMAMVNADIAWPAAGGDAPRLFARRFNEYYEREAQKRRRHAREAMYADALADYKFSQGKGYPFNPYELMQVFDVSYNSMPVLSLYFDVYQYTGGAHGMTERTGNTWDLHRCRMLEMRDLFARGYDYRGAILRYVEAEALRRQAGGEAQYFEGLAENVYKYFDERNYYLSCQGLNLFYPLYSLAPYYVGIQAFAVPYGIFGNNLAYPLIALCT